MFRRQLSLGRILWALLIAISGLGCGEHYAGLLPCEGQGEIDAHCGFQNPEDLVVAPGGQELVVSEMGTFLEDTPGQLSLFDLESKARLPLAISWLPSEENWADPACPLPEPPLFSPHGIDLRTRADGRHALFVVNHGGRESVEVFELAQADGVWTGVWRGCAMPPGDPMLNDVTAFPDGGFAVTHMWDKQTSVPMMMVSFLLELDTGWVWIWDPEQGFSKLPGSDATAPNGITSSPDGRSLYVNHYVANKTVRVDRRDGTLLGEVEVRQPDNVTLDEAGRLWIAGHNHFVGDQSCEEITGACPHPFSVVVADSSTMEGETVFRHEGAPMGYATVALAVGDRLFLGSASGDRMISLARPQWREETGSPVD